MKQLNRQYRAARQAAPQARYDHWLAERLRPVFSAGTLR